MRGTYGNISGLSCGPDIFLLNSKLESCKIFFLKLNKTPLIIFFYNLLPPMFTNALKAIFRQINIFHPVAPKKRFLFNSL